MSRRAHIAMVSIPAHGHRLVELGVARRLDTAHASAEALREALLQLTGDPQVSARLAAIRAEIRTEGGTARAADWIEAALVPSQ